MPNRFSTEAIARLKTAGRGPFLLLAAIGGLAATILLQPVHAQPVPESPSVAVRLREHRFPRLAVQIQPCCSPSATASIFSRIFWWDLAIVDATGAPAMAEYLGAGGRIRRANPTAVLLGYFSAGDVILEPDWEPDAFTRDFDRSWVLRDVRGDEVRLYKLGRNRWTRALNPTTPVQRAIPTFVNDWALRPGHLDGMFFDWAATDMSWLNHRLDIDARQVDIDGDGLAESDEALNTAWRQGYAEMLQQSRQLFPNHALIVGNAGWNTGPDYAPFLNGIMIEQFLEGESMEQFKWSAVMRTYAHYATRAVEPRVSVVMANRDKTRGKERAFMRFALASTLMFDGYFSFTNRHRPSSSYQTTRWFDEYSVDRQTGMATRDVRFKGYLGTPLDEARSIDGRSLADVLGAGEAADTEVWQREFEHGRVLVNPSRSRQTVDLGSEYRRIRGLVDKKVNNGALVRVMVMPPRSGAIVLKAE
jgi:hypothetical protein